MRAASAVSAWAGLSWSTVAPSASPYISRLRRSSGSSRLAWASVSSAVRSTAGARLSLSVLPKVKWFESGSQAVEPAGAQRVSAVAVPAEIRSWTSYSESGPRTSLSMKRAK